MEIRIRRLTPELWKDYVEFFDNTTHDTGIKEHKCYCVCWCNDDYDGKDFSTAEKRRQTAIEYVKHNNIQGYLAYQGNKVVGWCNANTKADCLKCVSWRMFMHHVPLDEERKVKSVFCFVIEPTMKRQGIATQLLNRVIQDAIKDEFDAIEAYPYKESSKLSSYFGGYVHMYEKLGFLMTLETEQGYVMTKSLR
ncbi:MAG: GNAT family N-acetyltransferase [Methanomicrobia archaeon]|nr:GNAT family N-acetyltransferase [Methanomicrobia archaeon]